jgi:parallel beta-helix repeat protein
MRRLTIFLAGAAALFTLGSVAGPVAVAGAVSGSSTLWVSNVAAVGNNTSCSRPGYGSVSAALAAAPSGATIKVCSGTYDEQLAVTQPVAITAVGSVTIAVPASPTDSTTACDTALTSVAPGGVDMDGISVCTAGTVKLTGLTVSESVPMLNCSDNLYGILVAGGANLVAKNVTVDGATESPLNGCQLGIGIEVGASSASEVGTATLTHVSVSDYQKNGITVDGAGSSAKISNSFVTGAGPTDQIAQNGIQISDGAVGTIKSSTVSGNECDQAGCGPSGLADQATGVLFYGAGAGSSITKSSLTDNDLGAYYLSLAASEPTSSEVSIAGNTVSSNRYEGIVLDQGKASVSKNTIEGSGEAGIEVLQYDGQAYAPASSASKNSISGQQVGVEVLSDNSPTGDLPGSFNISHSAFLTTNTQAESDNSTNYTIVGSHNT